jgi:hypothetical protein
MRFTFRHLLLCLSVPLFGFSWSPAASAQTAPVLIRVKAAKADDQQQTLTCYVTVPRSDVPSGQDQAPDGPSPTDILASAYYKPDWKALTENIKADLLACKVFGSPQAYDAYTKSSYLMVAFPSTTAKKDPEFLHVILHQGLEAYALRLPYEENQSLRLVFLSARDGVELRSLFLPTKVDSKIQTQLASFLGKLPITTFLPVPISQTTTMHEKRISESTLGGAFRSRFPPKEDQTPADNLFAGVADVQFSGSPSTIQEQDDATFSAGQVTESGVTDLKKAIEKVAASHAWLSRADEVCGQFLDSELKSALNAVVDEVPKALLGKDQPLNKPHVTTWSELEKGVNDAVGTVAASATAGRSPKCAQAPDSYQRGMAVIQDYRTALAAPDDVTVSSSISIDNSGLTKFEFTAVAGVLAYKIHKLSQPKVKLDSGVYADDAPSRGFTMVAVAWHPVPYDSARSTMSRPERVSILFGAAVTPAAGLAVGLSVKPFSGLRGLAFTGGLTYLVISTVPKNLDVGAVVGKTSLRTGQQFYYFGGISFAFGG